MVDAGRIRRSETAISGRRTEVPTTRPVAVPDVIAPLQAPTTTPGAVDVVVADAKKPAAAVTGGATSPLPVTATASRGGALALGGLSPHLGPTEKQTNWLVDKLLELHASELSAGGFEIMPMVDFAVRDDDLRIQYDGLFHNLHVSRGAMKVKGMTPDIAVLRLAHELGHVLGAGPRDEYQRTTAEGEADYFAPRAMRRLLEAGLLPAQPDYPAELVTSLRTHLEENGVTDPTELAIRLRIGLAAWASLTLEESTGTVHPSTPDTSVVTETKTEYPSPQARLDTYLAALTDKPRPSSWAAPGDFSHPPGGK